MLDKTPFNNRSEKHRSLVGLIFFKILIVVYTYGLHVSARIRISSENSMK
jgi:hypothetical protein